MNCEHMTSHEKKRKQMMNNLMTWHDDGHVVNLQIRKSELEILDINCPYEESPDKPCQDRVYGCLVKHFIHRYGMECNAGQCDATPSMRISWTLIGDERVIDECQLWFMPNDDEVFAAWLNASKRNPEEF